MRLKKSLSIFLCFSVLVLSSCKLEDDRLNFRFIPLQIVSAEVPDSFDLNETYQIYVTYIRPSTCVTYEGFDITDAGRTTRNVVAIGSEFYDEPCTQSIEERETFFNFIVLYDDPYLFRFWTGKDENGNDQYLEIEVPVNP